MSDIQLYHGDCSEIMDGLIAMGIKVDCVITDPPYLLETEGAGFFGKKSDEYSMNYKGKKAYTWGGERYVMQEINNMKEGFSEEVMEKLCKLMKKINIYFFCSQKQLPILYKFFVEKKNCNWNLLCWHKTNPIPACGNKYLSDSEYIMFFREKGVKIYGNFDTKRTYYVSKSNMEDKRKYGHPTIKPLEMIRNFIINSTNEGDLILDPYMGTGTTGVGCKELNRNFTGIDIDEKWVNIARERINAD